MLVLFNNMITSCILIFLVVTHAVSSQQCGEIKLPGTDLRNPFLVGQNPREAIPGLSPWSMSLEYQENHVCSAVLIDPSWAVTSARCVADRISTDFQVVAGIVDRTVRDGSEQIISVSLVIIHPEFENDGFSYPNDIALLELSELADIEGRMINTICLPPSPETKYWENPSALISGWGITNVDDSTYPNTLQQAWVDVIRPAFCDLWWPEDGPVNHDMHQCVFYQVDRQVSICDGDGGAALQCLVDGVYYLAGLASLYFENCSVLRPSVFTDVPIHLEWILENTGISVQ